MVFLIFNYKRCQYMANLLDQLKAVTVAVADTGDIAAIEKIHTT
ncbi:Transaldolase [methanotrophic endosymbiont of Bathymodiolus azoricus (Menez Gwen)]|nr:Transaldolase [methanotrophic endosymbiont of Bathymodiolus azoricus (Menez Gwen)]